MKKNSLKIITFFLAFCFILEITMPLSKAVTEEKNNQDIYDVILFWGGTNMVGNCGRENNPKYGKPNEQAQDEFYNYLDEKSVKDFSKITGIDKEILSNSPKMNYVKINQEKNTAYEYKYLSNSLQEMTENYQYSGEYLKYNETTKKLESIAPYSISRSIGTNLIPEFCKTYYEETGHKVVAVCCAIGNEKLANFLPSTDIEYGEKDSQNKRMIYEAMVTKYKAAIEFMEKQGLKVTNRIWISFHGEADIVQDVSTTTSEYKKIFEKIHKYLKKDLKINKGVLIETSGHIGVQGLYDNIQNIHNAQVEIAKENGEIILGSTYAYDRYIPDKNRYNSDSFKTEVFLNDKGQKLEYEKAFEKASYSVCYPNNLISLKSIALSQIGKETAKKVAYAINIDTIKSEKYKVDEYNKKIKSIPTKTTVKEFKTNIKNNMEYIIKDQNGKELTENDYIGTGCRVVLKNNKVYTLIITGDLNGNGNIELNDIAKIQKIFLKIINNPKFFEIDAADINNNGSIDLNDIARICKIYIKSI